LLGNQPSPGYSQNINAVIAELIEQSNALSHEVPRAIRRARRGRAADTGHIEDDCLRTIQHIEKWLDQFDIRTNSVEQKQWRLRLVTRANADPQSLSAYLA
jgi:hypothetical protein